MWVVIQNLKDKWKDGIKHLVHTEALLILYYLTALNIFRIYTTRYSKRLCVGIIYLAFFFY